MPAYNDLKRRDECYAAVIAHEKAGEWSKVLEVCLTIAGLDIPDLEKSIGWINAAKAHGKMNDMEQALACFDNAVRLEAPHKRCFALANKAKFLADNQRVRESLELHRELAAREDLYSAEL